MNAEHRLHLRRPIVLFVLTLAVVGLAWRAIDLQLTHKDFLRHQADARHLRVVKVAATRGKIVDREGQSIAISTPVDSIWINPKQFATQRDRWSELTKLLKLDADALHRLVAKKSRKEFVYLKRHVDPEVASLVSELRMAGVYLQREYRRYYPTGEVAAHVVGFTNVDDDGQEGLELAYDDWLTGHDGAKRVLRDRYGRAIKDVEHIETRRDGVDLVLSVDKRMQYLAYRALKSGVAKSGALGGSVVLMDARTGEVLAMANQPAYNPNNRTDRVSSRYRNRAVTDVFEPGSTVKPFTVAAALQTGLFKPNTRIDTSPGVLKVGRHKVHDHRNYGVIDVATVLKKSSNVGASKIALKLPPERLWQTFASLGFGAVTGSGFPGESAGILTDFTGWADIERATVSFGYGLSVTPLQLAQAYSIIASGGLMYPTTFVKVLEPEEPKRVMAAHAALQVRGMLEAVTGEGGTGQRARISGYRVAGKTGTVRKSTVGGYFEDRYVAVFAGMAPASAPRLVVVVVIDEPSGTEYYGGQIAAPIFSEVMAGALRIKGIAPDAPGSLGTRVFVAEGGVQKRDDGVVLQ